MEGMNFAAIDIGTNAARLLIKNIDHNPLGETKYRKVLFIRYPLRLGMDVFSKGKIGKERAEMMMRMIKGFKQMMRLYDVVDYRACATSAMRDAKNGKALIAKIEKKTGIRIDLIDGREEAGILYGNHIEQLPDKEGTFMYVDVGGGSTEITLIHQGKLVGSMSYNIGTIRLLNRAVKDGIVDGLKADMEGMYINYGPINIIGSGGNINKLFRLAEDFPPGGREKQEGTDSAGEFIACPAQQTAAAFHRGTDGPLRPEARPRGCHCAGGRDFHDYCRLHPCRFCLCADHRACRWHYRRLVCQGRAQGAGAVLSRKVAIERGSARRGQRGNSGARTLRACSSFFYS